MCHVESFIVLLCLIVPLWHFFPDTRLLLFWCNKIYLNCHIVGEKVSSSAFTFTIIVTIIISVFVPGRTCVGTKTENVGLQKPKKSEFNRWDTNPHFQSHDHVINFPYPSQPSTQPTCGSPTITKLKNCCRSEFIKFLVMLSYNCLRIFPKGQNSFSLPIPQCTEDDTINVNVMYCL